jgi:CDGSH-type Zn-finger protein
MEDNPARAAGKPTGTTPTAGNTACVDAAADSRSPRHRNSGAAMDEQNTDTPQVTIKVNRNGSYLVEGPARLIDADGNEYDLSSRKRVSLCRCGASVNKPFCDGTHSKIGFAAAERAVREAEGGT